MRDADVYWSSVYRQGRSFLPTSDEELDLLTPFLESDSGKALDVGCGKGGFARALADRGFQVTAFDPSSVAIDIAARSQHPGVRYMHGDDRTCLPQLSHQRFALVVCRSVFAFIEHKEDFLSSVSELLDANGVLVIVTSLAAELPPARRRIGITDDDVSLLSTMYQVVAKARRGEVFYFICRSAR